MNGRVTGEIGKFVAIGGTHAWSDALSGGQQWWHPDSTLAMFLARDGLTPLRMRPFVWSTYLDGWQFWRRWLKAERDPVTGIDIPPDHRGWAGGGHHLIDYLDPECHATPYEERNLFAHSHGGQLVFYALALGLEPIRTLITFGTPVRADMEDVIKVARPKIGYWIHVIDADDDDVADWGVAGDGRVRWPWSKDTRKMQLADENLAIEGIGHSKALNDPSLFHLWLLHGLTLLARTGTRRLVNEEGV